MEAKCKVALDLVQRGADPVIHVVQGDTGTRVLELGFYAAGVAWAIPEGVSLAMRFRKPDGTQGIYTKLPDNTDAATISTTDRSKATFKLAPQTMTVAGDVKADLAVTSVDQVIASFPIILRVHENPAGDQPESEDYYAYPTLGDINAELDKLDKLSKKAVYKVNGVLPDEGGNVNTPGAGTGGEVVSVNGKNGIVVLGLKDLTDYDDGTETLQVEPATSFSATVTVGGKLTASGGLEVNGDLIAKDGGNFQNLETTGKATLGSASIGGNDVAAVVAETNNGNATNDNSWAHRRYSDGTCDLWAFKYIDMPCTTEFGNWYRSNEISMQALPFTMASITFTYSFEMDTSKNSGCLLWNTAPVNGTTGPKFYAIRPMSGQAAGYIDVHIWGRWK